MERTKIFRLRCSRGVKVGQTGPVNVNIKGVGEGKKTTERLLTPLADADSPRKGTDPSRSTKVWVVTTNRRIRLLLRKPKGLAFKRNRSLRREVMVDEAPFTSTGKRTYRKDDHLISSAWSANTM